MKVYWEGYTKGYTSANSISGLRPSVAEKRSSAFALYGPCHRVSICVLYDAEGEQVVDALNLEPEPLKLRRLLIL